MPRIFAASYRFQLMALVIALILATQGVVASGQKPGTSIRTFESGGKQRTYVLHLPRTYRKKQKKLMPMVFMLHGSGGTGKGAASFYYDNWKNLADKEKFVAVFPDALGSPTRWKSWGGQPTADTKFLAALIDKLTAEFPIDKNRTFMTGHSSGGYMSFSFGAVHPEKVAAIGPVAGLYGGAKVPSVPLSVISFHGMADNVVGYESDLKSKAKFSGSRGAVESAAFFAHANGSTKSERKDIKKGRVHIDTWAKGKDNTQVVLYSLEGWGHRWPKLGSRSIAATELIWKFFKSHPRKWKARKKIKGKPKAKQGK